MENREKIAGFISYHNIIRPVKVTLLVLPFSSSLCLYLFGTGSIWPSDKIEEPVILYIEFFISAIMLIVGIGIRRRILERKEQEPGKCLYLAQVIMYIYIVITSMLVVILAVLGGFGIHRVLLSIAITLAVGSIAVVMAYVHVRGCIDKGYYLSADKMINEKVIAFSTSGTFMVIYMTFFQFVKRNFTVIGGTICAMILAAATAALAFTYYLKLRYAKKYGLEEYLPKGPHASPYTGGK